jgi:hypothetical protein
MHFNKFVKLRSKFQALNSVRFLLCILNQWLEDDTVRKKHVVTLNCITSTSFVLTAIYASYHKEHCNEHNSADIILIAVMFESFLSKNVSMCFPVLKSCLQVGYGLFNATFQ